MCLISMYHTFLFSTCVGLLFCFGELCRFKVLDSMVISGSTLLPYYLSFSTTWYGTCCIKSFSKCKIIFSKIFLWPFGISLFISIDTCKGKTAYSWISPNPV